MKFSANRPLIPLLLMAAAALLGACTSGGGMPGLTQDPAHLPGIMEFDQPPLRETSYTDIPDHAIEGDLYFLASPDAVIDGNDVILSAPAGGVSYAIFQFGQFFYADQALSFEVNAKTPAGAEDEDVEYYLGISDYNRQAWAFSDLQAGPGIADISAPEDKNVVSPGEYIYVCVIAHDSATVEIEEISGHFKLLGRVVFEVESLIPYGELANRNVALEFNVVDEDGVEVFGYNATGEITADPAISVVLQPEFSEGQGEAVVQFPAVGTYQLSLSGFGAPVDGLLAEIEAYETQLPVLEIQIAKSDLRDLYADVWSDEYKFADFTIDGALYPGIQTRFRGGSSREFKKKSWKVKLNSGAQYDDPLWGYTRKTFNINAAYIDQSLMRDKLSYDLAQDLGVLAPRARFVHLRVNDAFQGLYIDVENPRTDWLVSMSFNDQGSLYKANNNHMNELPSPEDYLSGFRPPFEKELRENDPADDLAFLIHELNNWPGSDIYDELNVLLDTEMYASYSVLNTLTSQSDALWKNYYLYNDFLGSGKWIVFPWDYDLTWGRKWSPSLGLFDPTVSSNLPLDYGDIEKYGFGNVLVSRYLNDPRFEAEYIDRLNWALDNVFTESAMQARIDAYHALAGPDANADRFRWTPGGLEYGDYVEELRQYVADRIAFVEGELAP